MTGEHAALIGLDWGTTSFRAYRIGPAGRVLEQRERDAGILKVQDGDFAGTLQDAIGDWLAAAPDLPVLAAGMIGSRQGWREAPYAPCPAGLAELAGGLVAVPAEGGRAVRLVPGVIRPADGRGTSPTSCAARRPRSWATSLRARPPTVAATSCPAPTASGPGARAAGSRASPPT